MGDIELVGEMFKYGAGRVGSLRDPLMLDMSWPQPSW